MISWSAIRYNTDRFSKTIKFYKKNMKNINNKGFTLIELVVSVTILSIIMLWVFSVFFLASDLNNKIDISRSMQENVKNIVETVADDIKSRWVSWVELNQIWDTCKFPDTTEKFRKWTKICTLLWNTYYLAKENWWSWIRVFDYSTECALPWSACTLVKNDWTSITPLSNSWVEFKNLYFTLSRNSKLPLVNINFLLQPSAKKWIKLKLIQDNKINVQTTISWRLYDIN